MVDYSIDRRIRPPKDMKPIMEELADAQQGVFSNYAELLTFAAAIGFHFNKRTELKTVGEGIRLSVFDKIRFFDLIIDTIAFAETEDENIFKSENNNNYVTIFEEYAYGGLIYIDDVVCKAPGDNLHHLINLISSIEQKEESSDEENLLSTFSEGLFED